MSHPDEFARLMAIAMVESGAATLAILASVSALITAVGGGASVFFLLRANRRRLDAESRRIEAEAAQTSANTGWTGTIFIKDMSEAASTVVAMAKGQAEDLQNRVDRLEDRLDKARERIAVLESDNEKLTRELHQARERHTQDQERFQRQLQSLMLRYGLPSRSGSGEPEDPVV